MSTQTDPAPKPEILRPHNFSNPNAFENLSIRQGRALCAALHAFGWKPTLHIETVVEGGSPVPLVEIDVPPMGDIDLSGYNGGAPAILDPEFPVQLMIKVNTSTNDAGLVRKAMQHATDDPIGALRKLVEAFFGVSVDPFPIMLQAVMGSPEVLYVLRAELLTASGA
jgi:hypothetical protein